MPPGEIVAGIVGAGIKNARLRSAEAALGALQNVAAILGREEALRRRLSASGAKKLRWACLRRNHHARQQEWDIEQRSFLPKAQLRSKCRLRWRQHAN
jgi:hypothetical protein